MPVSEVKKISLNKKLLKHGLNEADITETFTLASGSGGQKVNKTASCVQLKHVPSGLEVRCQKSRSQADNRYFARVLLLEKYQEQILQIETKRKRQLSKLRKQKARRSRKTVAKLKTARTLRTARKQTRQKVDPSNDY